MAESIKVFELAKEFNIKALELIDKIKPLELQVKNHMSDLTAEQAEKIRVFLQPPAEVEVKKKPVVRKKAVADTVKKPVVITKSKSAAETAALAEAESAAPVAEAQESVSAPSQQAAEPEISASPVETTPTTTGRSIARRSIIRREPAPVFEKDETPAEPVVETAPEPEQSSDSAASSALSEDAPAPTTTATAVEAPAASSAPAPAAAPSTGRKPRYSVIRVVSNEPAQRAKPLIVEDAASAAAKVGNIRSSVAPKTFSDPDLSKSAAALLQREIEEENRKKKGSTGARVKEDENFKSTDYLRRERVYQPKKKKLSLGRSSGKGASTVQAAAHKRVVGFDTGISVEDLAHDMSLKAYEVVKKLRGLGVEQPDEVDSLSEWMLDLETASLVAAEFGFEVKDRTFNEDAFIQESTSIEAESKSRSPVITIMGHVDHGKTSLLDIIRKARVAAGEAGGITQHIGAYTVTVAEAIKNLQSLANQASGKGKKEAKAEKKASKNSKGDGTTSGKADRLTFLDTPGHAAFTAMRSRGAKITDIVVLVVAASEGVMPQTREAIDHAKAAGVPIIVAMNKMDLPDANPDRLRQQLSEVGLISEEWGGDVIFVPVSAKTGMGVDKLLEMIQLQAEVIELKARFEGAAEGTLIEARLDKGRGPLASVLIRAGTLKVGDYIVAGTSSGKVRALIDDTGKQIREAGPSTPVEILGLDSVPEAGDPLNALPDERAARALVNHRLELKKSEVKGLSAEEIFARMTENELKELPVILKADVKGSAEAIQAALLKLPDKKIKLKLISTSVGAISESDVLLASASKALIVGFNVRPDAKSQAEAERRGVQIKTFTIIYELLDQVTSIMEGLLDPTLRETVVGRAEVRNVFNLTKVGAVAGCFIQQGKVQRSNSVRLIRDGRVVYTGKLSGLKRFKDDAREVAEGYECGISIENYNDIKQGDVIEAFAVENVAQKLHEGAGASA